MDNPTSFVIEFGNGKIKIEEVFSGYKVSSRGLKEKCSDCSDEACQLDCEPSQDQFSEEQKELVERLITNAMIDGIESFLLSLITSGLVVPHNPLLKTALESTFDKISNQF